MAKLGAPKGNQNGLRAREWRDAIIRRLIHRGGSLRQGLDLAADRLLQAAIDDGERWAIEELGNRIQGRANVEALTDAQGEQRMNVIARISLVAVQQHDVLLADAKTIEQTGQREAPLLAQVIDPKDNNDLT